MKWLSQRFMPGLTPLTRNITVRLPEATTVLLGDEALYVIGEYEDILRFAEKNGLRFMDQMGTGQVKKPKFAGKFKFDEIGMAEVMILAKCFRTVKDAYRTVSWESVILFASMMSFAAAMEKTGTSAAVTNGIVDTLGAYGPYMVLAGILTATSFLTLFINNTTTAILFAAIVLQASTSLGMNSYPFLIGVTVAENGDSHPIRNKPI